MLRSRIFAASLIIMSLVGCARTNPTNEKQSEPVFVELSVTSFNVLSADSKSPWQPRLEPIKDIILRDEHHPDVFCLQETGNADKQNDLKNLFNSEYDHHLIGVKDVEASPSLIFWKRERFELVDAGWTDMLQGNNSYTAGKYSTHRYAHYVQLREKASGGEFLVYNLHLKTNGTSVNYQKLRYDLITSIAPAAKARSRKLKAIPVFMMGDFNNYWDTVYDGIPSAPSACAACGFTEVSTVAKTQLNLQYKTSSVDMTTGELDWKKNQSEGKHRIDYIFFYAARNNVEVGRYWTVLDFVDGSTTHVKTPVPSDHAPVNAVFTLKYQ